MKKKFIFVFMENLARLKLTMNKQRFVVFVLTFASYALYHASRKNLSGVKASIAHDWVANETSGRIHDPLFNTEAEAQTFLGTLDALFMICYAGALVYWGWLGDRFNPKNVVVLGMVGSAITLLMFGYIPYMLNFYFVPYYLIIYALFGVFQACGWPNEVTIMANWFDKNNRGLIMGMWAACQPLGNILGALFVSFILPYGYVNTFLFNSVLITLGGVVLYVFVQPRPSGPLGMHLTTAAAMNSTAVLNRQDSIDSNRSANSINSNDSEPNLLENTESRRKRKITILQALRLPTVVPYCLCNACLKFVNYAFFFWLPFYLTHKYVWPESEANRLSVMYDFGGIVGSVAGGFISDRLRFRSPILMGMLVISLPLLFIYANLGPNRFYHVLVMTCLGATISGPYNLIVGTIAVDLGSQKALAGNTDGMSTVTGLIDATGSAGSAIGQLFVPIIQNNAGWKYVFYLFIIMNILSSICLLKRFLHDCFILWKCYQLGVDVIEAERTTRSEGHPLLA